MKPPKPEGSFGNRPKAKRGLTQAQKWAVYKRDGFKCHYCGRDAKTTDVVLEIDHVIPIARGGTDDPQNLITGCRECNSAKSSRSLGPDVPEPTAESQCPR